MFNFFSGNKVEIHKQRHIRIYNAHESGAGGGGGGGLSVFRFFGPPGYFFKKPEFFSIDIIF